MKEVFSDHEENVIQGIQSQGIAFLSRFSSIFVEVFSAEVDEERNTILIHNW